MIFLLGILIFIRPFISSLAYPYANAGYNIFFLSLTVIWIIAKGINKEVLKQNKYPLTVFILGLLIATVFSRNFTASIKQLPAYISYLSVFIIAGSLKPGDGNRLIRICAYTGIIISFLAIYQYLSGFRHLALFISKENISSPFVLDYLSSLRVFFPFVTPNALGGYLAMIIPLLFIFKNKIPAICLMLVALLLTKSLGALLACLISLCAYINLSGKGRKAYLKTPLILLAAIAVVFIIRALTLKAHMQPLFSVDARLAYWLESFKFITQHPVLGIGPGNFNLNASRYAHNSFFQLWVETGILGITGFIWLVFGVIKRAGVNKTSLLLAVSSAAFLAHNLVDFTFFLPEISLIWWAILGLADSFGQQKAWQNRHS